jgi:cyclohexyl-isocyanide hydratase
MKLGMPVYQGVNMLDVAGPLEMFYWAGQSKPLQSVLVSADGGSVTAMNGACSAFPASMSTPPISASWCPATG